jgi:hypothetical protein
MNEMGNPLDETIDFTIYLPSEWTVSTTETIVETFDGDNRVVMASAHYATFEDADTVYRDAVVVRDIDSGLYKCKYYHMQPENTSGETTILNELIYCIAVGDRMMYFTFYPYYGTGIGTQSEQFTAYISTLELTSESDSQSESTENTATVEFSAGPDGEKVSLGVGDQLGDWTLADLQIQQDGQDAGRVNALFVGDVTLRGTITRAPFDGYVYDFSVGIEDASKMPYYIFPDATDLSEGNVGIRLDFADSMDGIVSGMELEADESKDCVIIMSDYRFALSPRVNMLVTKSATVVGLKSP